MSTNLNKEKFFADNGIVLLEKFSDLGKVIADRPQILEFMSKITAETPCGKYDFGEEGFVNVIEPTTKEEFNGVFEVHEFYYDIQCILSGEEKILCGLREDMEPTTEFNKDGDYQLFKGDKYYAVEYNEGEALVLPIHVLHAPGLAITKSKKLKKAIIKIKL